jgi:soluble lytic murein transglycosylase
MLLNRILTLLGALALTGLMHPTALAQNLTAQDEVLLQMQQAFTKGDRLRLQQLLTQTQGHTLEPWAAYWALRVRLDTASTEEIERMLSRYTGTYAEDRLRADWLLQLGKQRDWATFKRIHPGYRMRDDREIQCYALGIEAMDSKANVAAEVKRLWYSLREADDGCTYVAEHLHNSKKLSGDDIWRKARLAMDANRPKAARMAVEIEAPRVADQMTLIASDPERYLSKRIVAITHKRKELAVLALIRLASKDPDEAAELLEKKWGLMLSREEKDWTWGVIGKQAAQKLQDNAHSHFAKVRDDEHLNDDLLGWKVRAALRQQDWAVVQRAVAAMSPQEQRDPTWVYWGARAQLALARTEAQRQAARAQLQGVASMRGFYEQLAAEELGQKIAAPATPSPLTPEEKALAWANPGLQRALLAIRIGLRNEGVREWNYSTNLHTRGGMNERELLAAADLACKAEVWDRCINTSERTPNEVDTAQRYPMPLHDIVVQRSGEIGLDPAYVYGLIRQESRFIMDARSHVGASGLMQVMPATAKWTARKIGLSGFEPRQLTDKNVNVRIGTAYLKLVLDDFGGSMPLAAAAYNAGPSRSRAWRKGPTLEGAIWAENVPFAETRNYVKKVLSNTTVYASIITGQPQSLKQRLGTVGPRPVGQSEPDDDLP